jgi:hypothetical protein
MSFDLGALIAQRQPEKFRLFEQHLNPQVLRVLRVLGSTSSTSLRGRLGNTTAAKQGAKTRNHHNGSAAFVALVLGAIAGWFGGRSGVVHPVFADRVVPRRRAQSS